MKRINGTMALVAMGIALGSHAHAATLYTANAAALGETMYCDVVNTTNKPVAVVVDAMISGSVYLSSGPLTLQPNQAASSPGNDNGYCRFTVTGSKRSVAAMAVFSRNDNNHYTSVRPAQ